MVFPTIRGETGEEPVSLIFPTSTWTSPTRV
jgi:hypothetical protein